MLTDGHCDRVCNTLLPCLCYLKLLYSSSAQLKQFSTQSPSDSHTHTHRKGETDGEKEREKERETHSFQINRARDSSTEHGLEGTVDPKHLIELATDSGRPPTEAMSQAAGGVGVEDNGPRRSSIDKPPILSDRDIDDIDDGFSPVAFERLPEEIIQQ